MQDNGTDIEGGNWNPENIAALATGIGGFVVSLLTFAYIKFKQRFSDEQKTDIQLKILTHEDGRRDLTLIIDLKNDERYTGEYETLSNVTAPNVLPLMSPSTRPGNDDVMAENMQTVMGNNNLGDQIIGETRNHVTRDVLNTVIKLEQLRLMAQDGDNNGPLNVHSLRSPDQAIYSQGSCKSPPLHLPNNRRFLPEPDSIKASNSIEESKESPPNNFSVAVMGMGSKAIYSQGSCKSPPLHLPNNRRVLPEPNSIKPSSSMEESEESPPNNYSVAAMGIGSNFALVADGEVAS